jgi:hypothetical protein
MMLVFDVDVPFEPFMHESLDSTSHTELPDVELESGLRITRTGGDYTASVRVTAAHPGAAKAAAIQRVESLLKMLAAENDGFTVEMSRVQATRVGDQSAAPAVEMTPSGTSVQTTATVFIESHLGIVKTKGSLAAEDAALARIDDLEPFIRNCLDLNYLLLSPAVRQFAGCSPRPVLKRLPTDVSAISHA